MKSSSEEEFEKDNKGRSPCFQRDCDIVEQCIDNDEPQEFMTILSHMHRIYHTKFIPWSYVCKHIHGKCLEAFKAEYVLLKGVMFDLLNEPHVGEYACVFWFILNMGWNPWKSFENRKKYINTNEGLSWEYDCVNWLEMCLQHEWWSREMIEWLMIQTYISSGLHARFPNDLARLILSHLYVKTYETELRNVSDDGRFRDLIRFDDVVWEFSRLEAL